MFGWHCYYFQSFNFIVFCLVQLYNRWGNAVCHGRESDIREGHKSFPSGHTSCKLRTVVAIYILQIFLCLFWLIYTMNWKSETLPMLLFGHFWRCTSYHLDHFQKEKSTRLCKTFEKQSTLKFLLISKAWDFSGTRQSLLTILQQLSK